jgi:hypothetical protein
MRKNIGDLFTDYEDGIYVLLNTKLGYICLDIKKGDTFGGLHRTITEATNGLEPMGYKLDLKAGKEWEVTSS